VYIVAEEDKTL